MSTWTKPLYQYSHMVLFVFSIGRNEISTSLLMTFWFCWFCQCTLGSGRGKTSITHIPSRHAPLSYWHITGGNRWTSHDTKVVALLLHPPSYRATTRFHVQHKAVYSSTTDWPNWANPFCLIGSVPRPQALILLKIAAAARTVWAGFVRWGVFYFISFVFIYHVVETPILDQQNAHSKWLFSACV